MNIKYRGSNPKDGGLPVLTPNLDALLRGHIERVNELQKHIERLEADNAALRLERDVLYKIARLNGSMAIDIQNAIDAAKRDAALLAGKEKLCQNG